MLDRTYVGLLGGWEAKPRAVRTLTVVAIVLMVAAAAHRLPNETDRLLHDRSFAGAVDLRLTMDSLHRWHAGGPVYGDISHDNHPPATLLVLWPLMGPFDHEPARRLWLLLYVAGVAALVAICLRGAAATTTPAQLAVALAPVAMFATAATIGNGQLSIFVVAAAAAAALVLDDDRVSIARDAAAAACLLFALAKPTVAAPFFWLLLAIPRRLRPALLVLAGYAALTLASTLVRPEGTVELVSAWLARGTASAADGSTSGGYANVLTWASSLGRPTAGAIAGLVLVAAFGAWSLAGPRRNVWVLLGVGALVARFWTYHRLYDDVLILLPMIALYRVAAGDGTATPAARATKVRAATLLAATWVTVMAPARVLAWNDVWSFVMAGSMAAVWILDGWLLVTLDDRDARCATAERARPR